jgi:hypothetical protein
VSGEVHAGLPTDKMRHTPHHTHRIRGWSGPRADMDPFEKSFDKNFESDPTDI